MTQTQSAGTARNAPSSAMEKLQARILGDLSFSHDPNYVQMMEHHFGR
jgi:hypothetical protein